MWRQSWVTSSPLGGLPGPQVSERQEALVASFIDSTTNTWDVAKLQAALSDTEVEMVCQIKLPRVPCEDAFCWPWEQFGFYSVKSGYKILRGEIDIPPEARELWLKTWKCKIPPKIRVFAWRLMTGILPLKGSLFHRHIIPSDSCMMCGMATETRDHCFVHCPWAREVWRSSPLVNNPTTMGGEECLLPWLSEVALNRPLKEFGEALVLLWVMWRCRNECVFDAKLLLSSGVMVRANRYLQQLIQATATSRIARPLPAQQNKWSPPPEGVIKLNCDGSFKEDGRTGMGAICRAHDRETLAAFCGPGGHCSSVKEAEAVAIREGLVFARDCGFRRIIVESDACEVLKEITHTQASCSLHGNIIQEIRLLQTCFEEVSFHFAPRQCNSVADRLASLGVFEPQSLYWIEENPECISDVVLIDLE